VSEVSAERISQLANPDYLLDELVHQITTSRPKVLVVGKAVLEVAKKAAVECGIADHNIYIMEEDDHGRYRSIWSLAGTEELEPRHLSPQEAKQRTAFMCYSSGTTGKAKGGTTSIELTESYLTSFRCSGDHSLQSDVSDYANDARLYSWRSKVACHPAPLSYVRNHLLRIPAA
jgi:acyl-CoA synthetase (AMP-forming)/AMP-acid ligase II